MDHSVLLAAESQKGKMVFETLVAMARNLGMDVLCKGIETEAQEQLARRCGCRYGQGIRYLQPASREEWFDRIEKGRICEECV